MERETRYGTPSANPAPSHQGVSLARRTSWYTFGAIPALPTKDAQPGQRLCLFQGSSTSAESEGVNIYVQLKCKPHPQLQLLCISCSSASGSCTSQKPKLLSLGETCFEPTAVATWSTHCTTSPPKPQSSWLGSSPRGMFCGLAASGEVLVKVSPRLVQERSGQGALH